MAKFIEIAGFEEPGARLYIDYSERQLMHIREPQKGIFIAESAGVIERALEAGYQPVSILTTREVVAGEAAGVIGRCGEIPVYLASQELFSHVRGFLLTRGVLCAFYRRQLPSVQEVCSGAGRIAVLEEVENPVNMGSIFRSAAALGVDAVLLTESCTDPLYRRAERVSMGTVFQVPWTYISRETLEGEKADGKLRRSRKEAPWPGAGMAFLKEQDFKTVAMALTDKSLPVDAPVLKREKKLAVFMGSEGYGLAQETIDACDFTVRIPMYHGVDSLNVAAASAVAFWELRRREG